ncbi:MAG TPA: HAD-IC family P-type ATPase [Pyrinomonadaceae bacterium]|nr:HAD-IC family P-type ATPase [Pyrinomonadaceae bacterium]
MELTGLTSAQVRERAAKGLRNVTSQTRTKRTQEIVFENLFSVFNLVVLLVVLFLLFFYFRTRHSTLILDSIGVLMVAVINTVLAITQEIKAKRALDKVNLLLERKVTVVRDGREVAIDQKEIVVDDLIIVGRGDQIVVDGRVHNSNHLEIDESLLTGESVPVYKNASDEVLSGSFCVSGNGAYVAERVGDFCFANKVTGVAKKLKHTLTPLQKKIDHLVEILLLVSILLVLLELMFDPHANINDMSFIRRLSTIIISLIPQGLVLMASITYALGVYRISKIGAIIEKLNAIESFSNVQIVCMDKTGTLTQNKLAVNQLTLLDDDCDLAQAEQMLGTYGKLSSDKNATLRTLAPLPANEGVELLDEIPFSSDKKMSMIKASGRDGGEESFIFGAFDLLLPHLAEGTREKATRLYEEGRLGVYRNVLFGRLASHLSLDDAREDSSRLVVEPICIVSITDQIRDDVMEAIQLFQSHGIRLKILSGDAPEAIQAVAREIGWEIPDDQLVTGRMLDETTDAQFLAVVMGKVIFARLKPDHKLKIIETLKREKIYTAMIGDGVNDLPAIKASDLGIAMEEGSKITKEVADIVLLKNRFSLLPTIFDEGNKIVNTVSAIAKLFLTKNFVVIYLALLHIFFLFNFPLTPRRVSLINIFTIALPSFFIALRNNNTGKTKHFSRDLYSFVIVSALFMIGAGYVGEYITTNYYGLGLADIQWRLLGDTFRAAREATQRQEAIQMVWLSVIIITSVANFFAVALHKGERNVKIYLLYGIMLLTIYGFLAASRIDFFLLNWLKIFYEINYLDSRYWGIVSMVGITSATLLFFAQKLREKLIAP